MLEHDRIGVGVIGCGTWGATIIRTLAAMPQVRLTMVSDLAVERLAAITEHHPNLRTTTDSRVLLRDPTVTAVVIATPIRTHFRLALAALQAGKHVLVEQPLATTAVEADRLVEVAGAAGRVLMVGHTGHYDPAIAALGELIRAGDLGDVFYVDCARLTLGLHRSDTNVIWDLAPHDVATLVQLLGAMPERVSAHGSAHVVEGVDDVAQINLRFPFGVHASLHLSWLDPVEVRRITVVGSRMMAVFSDGAEPALRVYDRRAALRCVEGFERPLFDGFDSAVEVPPVPSTAPLRAQLHHFIECLRTGTPPRSDGRVGAEVVRIVAAADTSRRFDGRWVDVSQPSAPSSPLRSSGVIIHISEATRARASRR